MPVAIGTYLWNYSRHPLDPLPPFQRVPWLHLVAIWFFHLRLGTFNPVALFNQCESNEANESDRLNRTIGSTTRSITPKDQWYHPIDPINSMKPLYPVNLLEEWYRNGDVKIKVSMHPVSTDEAIVSSEPNGGMISKWQC